MVKRRSRQDPREVLVERRLLPFELPVATPNGEVGSSAPEREVGHRDGVKFPGHDLLGFVFVSEGWEIFFLKRDGGRVSIACPFGDSNPFKDALRENSFNNLLCEFHTMSAVDDNMGHCTAYS